MSSYPVFGLPGILCGKKPAEIFEEWKAICLYSHPDNLADILGIETGETARIRASGTVNSGAFARALAKIAHAQVVARYGISGFEPCLPKLILGQYHHIPYLVGGVFEDPPPPGPAHLLHEIGIEEWGNEDQKLLVARIRLFANSGTDKHGMPTYYCVIGRPKTGG